MGGTKSFFRIPPALASSGCAIMLLIWLSAEAHAQSASSLQIEETLHTENSQLSPFGSPRKIVKPANPRPVASASRPVLKRTATTSPKPALRPTPTPKSALTSAQTAATGTPSSLKLQAGVTHSEVLTPLPETQRPGRIFRGDAIGAGSQRMKRFKVPDWMAGIWQRSEAREILRVELPSGRKVKPVGNQVARVRDVFGSFRDGNGQVWQIFNPLKATGQVDRGVSMDYHRVHSYDLVITGPKSVVVEVQATHTLVSKANRRIADVYQDEELNTYTLSPDGKLQTDSSVKVFDMEGKPFLLTRTMSSEIRLPPKNWPPAIKSPVQRN